MYIDIHMAYIFTYVYIYIYTCTYYEYVYIYIVIHTNIISPYIHKYANVKRTLCALKRAPPTYTPENPSPVNL